MQQQAVPFYTQIKIWTKGQAPTLRSFANIQNGRHYNRERLACDIMRPFVDKQTSCPI